MRLKAAAEIRMESGAEDVPSNKLYLGYLGRSQAILFAMLRLRTVRLKASLGYIKLGHI